MILTFTIIVLCVLVFLFSKLFIDLNNHRKKMRKYSEHSLFMKFITQCSREIIDSKVRTEFVSEYVGYILDLTKYDREFDLEFEKRMLYERWGKHIPSLASEFRDKKLKELGI
jgi:hypothetical protein